jgi:histidyl-tRNA synthetase
MTPSVTRLVASIYKEKPKPIRMFSIANFYRNESPQKGRTREFWQLNADIFGDESTESDIEVLSLAVEIMLAFGAKKDTFKLFYNSRLLLDDLFNQLGITEKQRLGLSRIMDKFDKINKNDFLAEMKKFQLSEEKTNVLMQFLTSDAGSFPEYFPTLAELDSYKNIAQMTDALNELGYEDFVEFNPSIIRGFDYYNGLIFEVYDLDPKNKRSLFGGGRYNGLSEIFGLENFPAIGFAPGNITLLNFLKTWDLLPEFKNEFCYCPLLKQERFTQILSLVNQLRKNGLKIAMGLSEKSLTESLRYANKQDYQQIIILGANELERGEITVKNLNTGEQKTIPFENFLSEIS